MAPALQGFCDGWRQIRSGLVSGLLMRLTWPLALMGSADRVPFCFADNLCPGLFSGLPDPRSDPVRHHFTSSLPTLCALRCHACLLYTSDAADE